MHRGFIVAILLPWVMACHVGAFGLFLNGGSAAGPYRAQTLATELGPSSVRTLGCLDVGLVPVEATADGPMVDLHVGNRCGHPEVLDLKRVAVSGFDADGELEHVDLSDPRNEIVPLRVGGAERGRERIRLATGWASDRLARLCFDLTRIAPDAPETRPRPVCFERDQRVWRASEDRIGT